MDSKKPFIKKLISELPPVPALQGSESRRPSRGDKTPGKSSSSKPPGCEARNVITMSSQNDRQDLKSCLRSKTVRNNAEEATKKVVFKNINLRPYILTADEILWKIVPRLIKRVDVNGRFIRDLSKREIVFGNLHRKTTEFEESEPFSTRDSQSSTILCDLNGTASSVISESEFPRPVQSTMSRIPVRQEPPRQPSQTQQESLFERVENRVISPHRSGRQLMLNRMREANRPPLRSGSSLEDYRLNRPSVDKYRRNENFTDDCRRNGSSVEDFRKPRKRKSLTMVTRVSGHISHTEKKTTPVEISPSDEYNNPPTSHEDNYSGVNRTHDDRTLSPDRFSTEHLKDQINSQPDTCGESEDDILALLDSAMELAESLDDSLGYKDDNLSGSNSESSQTSLEDMIKEILDDVTPPESYRKIDNLNKSSYVNVQSKSNILEAKAVIALVPIPNCDIEGPIDGRDGHHRLKEITIENSSDIDILCPQSNTLSRIKNGSVGCDPLDNKFLLSEPNHPRKGYSSSTGNDLLQPGSNCERDFSKEESRGDINIDHAKEQISDKNCERIQDEMGSRLSPSNLQDGVQNVQTNTRLKRGRQFITSVWRNLKSFKRRIKSVNCFSNSVE